MNAINEGAILGDRYRIGAPLGLGGMAEVHHAWDTLLQRPVAIKLFHSPTDQVAHQRFSNEAMTLARLSHPGLVQVYDAGHTPDGLQFLTLHLVEGKTLRDHIATGPMRPDAVRKLGADLADTLAYVHKQAIVHRDVKPSNVLLDASMTPFLSDFGIAKLIGAPGLTTTGHMVGTAGYLAPEQVRGDDIGCPADVYSLGLVLLECLTGRREYGGPDIEAAVARLNRPVHIPDDVPRDLAVLLTRMTALTPRRRPTAAECARLLRDPSQVLPLHTTPAAVPPAPEPVSVPRQQGPRQQGRRRLIAAVLAVPVTATAAWMLASSTQSDPPPVTVGPANPAVADTPSVVVVTSPAEAPPATTVVSVSTVVKPVIPRPVPNGQPDGRGRGKYPHQQNNGNGDN